MKEILIVLSCCFLFINCKTSVIKDKIDASPMDIRDNIGNLPHYSAANDSIMAVLSEGKRVVFLGNSITEVWANQNPSFFANNDFIGRGISGQTSPQLLLRFHQDVVSLDPYAVVIHIGTNDIAENTGPYREDYTVQNITSMVDIALANNIKVILAAVVPTDTFPWRLELGDCSRKVISLNEKIKKIVRDRNLNYLDYHSVLKNEKNGMSPDIAYDGVHPTEKGYEIMEKIALEVIEKVRKI